jgi:hypothetical protein
MDISLATLGRIRDVATAVVVQFLSTFAVWLIAERLHLSGILAVVAYAILVARRAPDQTPARLRIPSYAVWDVVVFVLNVLAFILVGLQLKPILEQLDRPQLRAREAQRRTLSDLLARGVIGDDAFHRVEEELDWAEVNAD